MAIFGTGDGHKLLLSAGDFRGNRRSESRGLLKGANEAVPSFCTVFFPSLAIFGTGYGHKLLLSAGDFRENRRSESRGLLKGANEALPSICTVFFRVWQYYVQEMATNDY